ncbi:hypothetical protein MCAMS1_02681 [biofilm metagenome]
METKLKALAAVLAMTSASVQAVGLITGPASPKASGSFPTYYQDINGLALEHCLPTPGAELNAAACLIGAADVPNPLLPITFPGNFPGETFFFAADSSVPFANGEDALLVMALEATFGAELPIEGDQILFARVRFRFVAPVDGEYTVTYPYGQKVVEGVAGERIFDTDDFGVTCGTDFTCAANGQIGPVFLRPSDVQGGAALDFYHANGKTYLAEPGVPTPVTGGSFGNTFRVDGPPGSNLGGPGVDFVETDLFTLVGRVNTNPLPSNISIEKSTFSRSADDNITKLDVNVKAVKALGQPDPQLQLFGNNMPGMAMTQDSAKSGQYYAQLVLSGNTVPDKVFVSDVLETTGRVLPVALADQVTVKKAEYDIDTHELHIKADSSDKSNSHHGSLELKAYGSDGKLFGNVDSDGNLDVALAATEVPPAKILVISNRHGSDTLEVTTTTSPTVVVPVLLTSNDSGVDETQPIHVTDNDTIGVSPIKVRIVEKPEHGNVTVNDANDTVSYSQIEPVVDGTPDSFSYYLTDDAGNISNISTVTFELSAGNLPPTANPDSASASAGSTVNIAVLVNDTDPENDALTLVSVEAGVGAVINGQTIDYTAPAAAGGTQQTFHYVVQDALGNQATGEVTVDISVPVTLSIGAAEYRTGKAQWRIDGTITPPLVGVTMTIYVDINRNGTYEASELLGTSLPTDPDGVGAWDFRTTTSPLVGVLGITYPVKVVSSMGVETTGNLTTRR